MVDNAVWLTKHNDPKFSIHQFQANSGHQLEQNMAILVEDALQRISQSRTKRSGGDNLTKIKSLLAAMLRWHYLLQSSSSDSKPSIK